MHISPVQHHLAVSIHRGRSGACSVSCYLDSINATLSLHVSLCVPADQPATDQKCSWMAVVNLPMLSPATDQECSCMAVVNLPMLSSLLCLLNWLLLAAHIRCQTLMLAYNSTLQHLSYPALHHAPSKLIARLDWLHHPTIYKEGMHQDSLSWHSVDGLV